MSAEAHGMTPSGSPEPPAKPPGHHAEAAGKAARPAAAPPIIRTPRENRALMRVSSSSSGGRMIDAIVTNTMLPAISAEFLGRMLEGKTLCSVQADIGEFGEFCYLYDVG